MQNIKAGKECFSLPRKIKEEYKTTYMVSISVLCLISMVSTICRSIAPLGVFIAKTASTTCCKHWNIKKFILIIESKSHLIDHEAKANYPYIILLNQHSARFDNIQVKVFFLLLFQIKLLSKKQSMCYNTIKIVKLLSFCTI